MMIRIIAITGFFLCTTIAWMVLGGTLVSRTQASRGHLSDKVASVWGAPQEQKAPDLTYTADAHLVHLPIESSRLRAKLDLDHRQKGLLWYSTYKVAFQGTYTFLNPDTVERHVTLTFPFPAEKAIYDDLTLNLDGKPLAVQNDGNYAKADIVVPAGARPVLTAGYRSQGLDWWKYSFGGNISTIRDFELQLETNFTDADFPENSLAPTAKTPTGKGWIFDWKYRNLVSGFEIALTCPEKLQPGPLAGEISFFAPVSLFFFFFLIFIITTMRGIPLHPMNYFFLAAAFFAFHLLLAYLVDHISIHLAFVVSSIVSIFLVVSYLRLVTGMQFAIREAAGVQFVYLVLFSYAFFFRGFTGLAITIGAVATLFVVMQATGRMRWEEKFGAVLNQQKDGGPELQPSAH